MVKEGEGRKSNFQLNKIISAVSISPTKNKDEYENEVGKSPVPGNTAIVLHCTLHKSAANQIFPHPIDFLQSAVRRTTGKDINFFCVYAYRITEAYNIWIIYSKLAVKNLRWMAWSHVLLHHTSVSICCIKSWCFQGTRGKINFRLNLPRPI